MSQEYSDQSQNEEKIHLIDIKEHYQSIDRISLKQKKAKRSLYEIGLEEDNLFSIQLATPFSRKTKIACVNAWSNFDTDQIAIPKRQKLLHQSNTQKITPSKPFTERQTNIPYLKDLLHKLENPGRIKAMSLNRKINYQNCFQEPIKNSYKPARVSETIKLKENWNTRDCEGRSTFLLPYSSLSCRLNKSQSKNKVRTTSQNSRRGLQSIKESDLIKMIMQKKKQSLMKKKKKPSPVKIINFKTKTHRIKLTQKQKFHLTQLLH